MSIEDDKIYSNYKNINIEFGVQVIFSTVPNQNNFDFEKEVEKNYFEDYKTKIDSKEIYLYRPLKFYLLGDYDVCYITLINNFKFSHRLFEPKGKPFENVHNAHSFQSFSGFALNEASQLKSIFSTTDSSYFIGIINLKLNNGLLIGNGLKYIEAVFEYLKSIIGETQFIITQTFSWFELSLVVLINNPQDLSDILYKIRMSRFKDLIDKSSLNESLYHSLLKGKKRDIIYETSLFADTHSYFGFNEKLITTVGLTDDYLKNFESYIKEHKIELETEIEWQVKPGHIDNLEVILSQHTYLKDKFDLTQRKVVLGKCDFLVQEVEKDILTNFHLIRFINRREQCDLYNHVRKVRTYVFLNGLKSENNVRQNMFCWDNELDKLAVKSKDFHDVDRKLKVLKISRQVRIKILKIFSNYNNGIQDPIQFIYFLDFTVFIRNLILLIDEEYNNTLHNSNSIRELEIKLNENIKVFQEGYSVRFLNGYQFENISDFDLDFNSSVQQLLTAYGSLVYEYGSIFYNGKNSKYGPLVQLNNIDTLSNYCSINYSIHHLTSPEFVFSTLLKEILNHLKIDNEAFKVELEKLNAQMESFLEKINESYLDDMVESNLVDFEYLIIDSIRFLVTFNGDFDLFEHWFWTYNFQNPSLFDTSGMFNEDHFKKELLRIMLVKKLFGIVKCLENPTAELFCYWIRHHDKIDKIADDLLKIMKKFKFRGIINSLLSNYLEFFKKIKVDEIQNSSKVMDYIIRMNSLKGFDSGLEALQSGKLKFIFVDKSTTDSILDIERLMFHTLERHFEKNNSKVTLLKRDWDTGCVLKNYDILYDDIFYSIDQTGGVYLYTNDKMGEYFVESANSILTLLNFSFISKKNFILKQGSK